MPDHIVKFNQTGRFMRFDEASKEFKVSSMGEATGFPSRAEAMEKIRQAAKDMRKSKGDGALPGWARIVCGLSVSPTRSQFISDIEGCFETQARPSFDDIAGLMELHYVHSATSGWLCRSWRKSEEAKICWADNFGLAIGFPDEAQARGACREHGGESTSSIFKASSVFVSVQAMPQAVGVHDPIREGIKTACEAREISGEIEKSARERLEALAQAKAEAKSKPAARL